MAEDVSAAAAGARSLGAKVLIFPTMLPEGSEMSVLLNPQGMSFTICSFCKSPKGG
jgi:predicted enzyme related to lactoylglutathione lyase